MRPLGSGAGGAEPDVAELPSFLECLNLSFALRVHSASSRYHCVACVADPRTTAPDDEARIGRGVAHRAEVEDLVGQRRAMYRCEAYFKQADGRLRIANIPIPRPLQPRDLTDGLRLVSVRVNHAGTGAGTSLRRILLKSLQRNVNVGWQRSPRT